MGIYGHKFDTYKNQDILSEGKLIDFLLDLHKDYKEFKQQEKIKKEIVKKYMKQGMSSTDAWAKMYKEEAESKKRAEEAKKKEKMEALDKLYTTEEKEKIKEIQEKIRKEFSVLKAKYFKARTIDGIHVDLKLDLFDFFSGANEDDYVLGVVDMIGGYEIEYDGNEDVFDQTENIAIELEKKIKNLEWYSDALDGRGFYMYIDKDKLK